MFLKIEKEIKNIVKILDHSSTYIVGGYVRDKLMHREPKDIDIVSYLSTVEMSKRLKLKPYIVNDRFNTARFYFNDRFIDYNCIEDINSDLKRRDFKINSIACDLNGKIYDPLNGISDIDNKVINLSSTISLGEDPIRILRAFRFKYQLGFALSPSVKSSIKKNINLLSASPKERIYIEFKELLSHNDRGKALRELYKAGILCAIFPDLDKTLKFIHIKNKSRFLMGHLLNTVEAVDIVSKERMPKEMRDYLKTRMFPLYLSALFHDYCKPESFTVEKRKQRFYNHDIMASQRIEKMLKRDLKASNEETNIIARLIRMHMRPHFLLKEDRPTDRGIYRLFRESADDAAGLMILCMADVLSSEGRIESGYISMFRRMKSIEARILKKQVRLLNGDEIMEFFKIKPGRLIGEMIDSANSWAVENNVTDKKIIFDYLKENFPEIKRQ